MYSLILDHDIATTHCQLTVQVPHLLLYRTQSIFGVMRPLNVAILVFLVAIVAYGWIGFLWIIFDLSFISGSGALATEATKVQTVAFISVFGALITAITSFVFEYKKV